VADLLVVDDNADIAALVEMMLVGDGHDVRVASDGAAGLRALSDRLPDLVLLDVDMPVLDGPSMAYRMLVEDCGKDIVPIVLVSATLDLPKVARQVGTPYMLVKPFDPAALLEVTARALAERLPPTPSLPERS
jgi:CheY-like chemotaxis protein